MNTKKKIILGLLIISIPLILLGVFIFQGLRWQRFYPLTQVVYLEVRPQDSSVWVLQAEILTAADEIAYFPIEGIEAGEPELRTIALPNPEYVKELCPSDQIWVRAPDNFISYDLETETWDFHPELDSLGKPISCNVFDNGNVVVISELGAALYDNQTWEYLNLDRISNVEVITQDANGQLWAGTRKKDIYRFNEPTKTWEIVADLKLAGGMNLLLVSSDNAVWVSRDREVYRITTTDGEQNIELALELSGANNHLRHIFEDNTGSVYIVGGNNIYKYVNGKIKNVQPPFIRYFTVMDAVFDPVSGRLYITDLFDGIHFLSLEPLP